MAEVAFEPESQGSLQVLFCSLQLSYLWLLVGEITVYNNEKEKGEALLLCTV